jgi:spermidine/putrescine transport system permease protein
MKRRSLGSWYALPAGVWITLFFSIPLLIIVIYSFLEMGLYGGVVHRFSLQAYRALINSTFVTVTISTLLIAVSSTVMVLFMAIPAAYYMARSRWKQLWLLLMIIPFWTNFLIRIYAWIAILGNNGVINQTLLKTGIISSHIPFLYNHGAVILVIVYTYLPFAILPLYATIEKFDFSLLEAACDLGATRWQAVRKVLLPNIKSGITTAVLFTFIPAFGQYAIPQLVGGRSSFMLGNIVARELTVTRNWPLASSISVVLTLVTTAGVLLFMRFNRSTTESARQQRLAEAH